MSWALMGCWYGRPTCGEPAPAPADPALVYAYHEGGHIITALEYGVPILRARASAEGGLTTLDTSSPHLAPMVDACITAAGPLAEQIAFPYPWADRDRWGRHLDHGDQNSLRAALWEACPGSSDRDVRRRSLLEEHAKLQARQCLTECWDQVQRVADALRRRGELSGAELARLCGSPSQPSNRAEMVARRETILRRIDSLLQDDDLTPAARREHDQLVREIESLSV